MMVTQYAAFLKQQVYDAICTENIETKKRIEKQYERLIGVKIRPYDRLYFEQIVRL
jgi:hypothetical protein